MSIEENNLPYVNLFGLEEMQRLALNHALSQQGIENPAQYLEEHTVEYRCAFKAAVGMAITITKVVPKRTGPGPKTRAVESSPG